MRRVAFAVTIAGLILLGACDPIGPFPASDSTETPGATVIATSLSSSIPSSLSPSPPPTLPPPVPDATPMPVVESDWHCDDGTRPCPDEHDAWARRISVPAGFRVSFIGTLPNGWTPTSIAYGPDGRLYAAAIPRDFDLPPVGGVWVFDGDRPREYAREILLPAGIAFRPGSLDLYVSHRASNTEGQISVIPPGGGQPQALVRGLPCCYSAREHQPNGLAFGPDGMLYLAIGARSDHGESPMDPLEAGVLQIAPDGLSIQKYADGMRNPYDLAFDSRGQLWATDNGADFGPPEELNRVAPGGHYGFPYYENCDICWPKPDGLETLPPYVEFPPHSTPVGLTAYIGTQFPANYFDNLFVALWNPGVWSGIMRVHDGRAEPFAIGFISPIDVVVAPDGALVVAEFWFGHIYRIEWSAAEG